MGGFGVFVSSDNPPDLTTAETHLSPIAGRTRRRAELGDA
jgi:hypothetical protein